MSEEKQYILRKPATIKRFPTEEGSIGRNSGYEEVVTIRRPDGDRLTDLYPEQFQELFVEFDEELLHQQLMQDKELFHLASLIGCEPEHEERRREKLADYVLGLIKGEQL